MGVLGEFISESVTGAATSGSGRVSTLGHKAGDDAVECRAIVESLTREKHEVIHRYRNITGEQLKHYVSLLCFNGGNVLLAGVDCHGWWC